MTAVYIRSEDYAEGAHLGDVDLADVDSVIATIARWGLMDESTDDLYGQFVYQAEQGLAYFEVVIGGPE